jgi:hypothetical protein
MEMRHLLKNPKYSELWGKSYTKELGRLAQGIPGMKGTDTIVFIKYEEIPLDRRRHVTYGKTVVSYRPEKEDPNRTRLTVGGNRIVYPGDVSTPTVEMMTVKMHLNSVIATKGAQYCTIDIKDFYLNTPMERPEFMRMKINDLPPEFVALYNLNEIADQKGTVYMRIQKGMYSLAQAGILAQRLLEQRLNKHGYHQSPIMPGLWKHDTRPISFTLCVDNFGVKYVGREHAEHLRNVLNKHYKCAVDWDGKKYLGMDIDWDYEGHKVHVSMLESSTIPAQGTTNATALTVPTHQAHIWSNKTVCGMWKTATCLSQQAKKKKPSSKKSLGPYCTTHDASMHQC